MARRPSAKTRLLALIDKFEPELRKVFLGAIDDLVLNADIKRIAELLEAGDIDGALKAVHIDPAVFRDLEDAIARAYSAGGNAAVQSLPAMKAPAGGKVVMRFDARQPRAELWLRRHSSNLVTAIVSDQREAIRNALRGGMEAGRNPRSTALDIVGRTNKATGRREGGIVGLTSGQENSVRRARNELLSGEEADLRRYLLRKARDRRFDGQVLKALTDGTAVPADVVDRAAGRYSDRLLKLRGDTIARTESLASLHASQNEAFHQAVDAGGIRAQDVRRVWITASDARVRDSHAAMEGESVGLDERFSNGLLFPGEPGGPPEEVINCRCIVDIRVDFLANLE